MIERLRGWQLSQLRKRLMMANPLCVACVEKGKVVEGTEADHILALVNGGTNDDDNYQLLCSECHREKTAQDLGTVYRPPIGADGWPIDR